MAYRTLSALFFAALVAAAPAYADSVATYERQCSRDKWSKVYSCWADYNSPYSSSSTYCSGGRCDTTVRIKEQPRPPAPIVQDPLSTRIMDGHGPR